MPPPPPAPSRPRRRVALEASDASTNWRRLHFDLTPLVSPAAACPNALGEPALAWPPTERLPLLLNESMPPVLENPLWRMLVGRFATTTNDELFVLGPYACACTLARMCARIHARLRVHMHACRYVCMCVCMISMYLCSFLCIYVS